MVSNRLLRQGASSGAVALLLSAVCLTPVHGDDSPHLVQAGDRALRSDLQWLTDRGVVDVSASSWPLSVATLTDALRLAERKKLSPAEEAALGRIRGRLAAFHGDGASMRVGGRTDSPLARGFSDATHGEAAIEGRAALSRGRLGLHLQATGILSSDRRDGDSLSADGSYASIGVANQLLSVGRVDRWWGPGMDGSLILGNAARPFTAVSLQRGKEVAPEWRLFSWIGPWGYHTFLGRLSDYQAVPGTRLFGLRLTARPAARLELGASRIIQWGGQGRPGGARTLWDAFVGKDNVGQDNVSAQSEPGNQIAGFDMRFTMGSSHPLTFYWQVVGEDEVGRLPSKNSVLLGVEGKPAFDATAFTWRVEAADTTSGRLFGSEHANTMYQHHIYRDGYYHRGQPLGHTIGGDGRLLAMTATWQLEDARSFELRALRAEVNNRQQTINAAYPDREQFSALTVGTRQPTTLGNVHFSIGARKSETFGKTEGVAEFQLEIPLLPRAR